MGLPCTKHFFNKLKVSVTYVTLTNIITLKNIYLYIFLIFRSLFCPQRRHGQRGSAQAQKVMVPSCLLQPAAQRSRAPLRRAEVRHQAGQTAVGSHVGSYWRPGNPVFPKVNLDLSLSSIFLLNGMLLFPKSTRDFLKVLLTQTTASFVRMLFHFRDQK